MTNILSSKTLHKILLVAVFAIILCVSFVPTASNVGNAPSKALAQTNFVLQWSDEFSGASGTGVNTTNWKYDTGQGVFGTGEIETMTTSTANVFQDGQGHLHIKALRDASGNWTSGRIETQRSDFQPPAGGIMRVESSFQQPNLSGAAAAGYWPAFWMLGATLRTGGTWPGVGEWDVMEDINGLSSVFGTLHCGTSPGGPCNETTGIGSGQRACTGCQTAMHTYAIEYDKSVSPEQLRWYLDGTNYFTINSSQLDATTWNNATHRANFIIYDLAMGGGFPNAFGGGPTASTVSGGEMIIDYVRVYYSGSGTSPTATSVPPTATPAPGGNGNPWNGTPAAIPGKVEAENFNTGGEGVAYHDTDATNNGGQYRTSEGVDIEVTTDTGGGYNVGWTAAGEWEKYTVNVQSSGTYNITFRVASAQTGGTFHLEVDGANVTGTMTVPNTGGWQVWTTLSKNGVSLSAGQHVLRWVTDAAGGNYNWMSFASASGPTPTFVPPTATPVATSASHSNVLYALTGASTLSFTAGAGAGTDTVASAGGANHDGTPTNPITYTISGVSGTYTSGNSNFALYLDSGTNVGNGVQVRVSYDFTGDGTWDRTETYHYFSTDPVVDWEQYNQTSFGGLESSTGAYGNLVKGKIKIEIWSAIGNAASTVRTSATSAQGQQSTITIPFSSVTG